MLKNTAHLQLLSWGRISYSLIFTPTRGLFYFLQLYIVVTMAVTPQEGQVFISNSYYSVCVAGSCSISVASDLDVEVKTLIIAIHHTHNISIKHIFVVCLSLLTVANFRNTYQDWRAEA